MTYGFNVTSLGCVTAHAPAAWIGRAVDEASLSITTTGKSSEGFESVARPNSFYHLKACSAFCCRLPSRVVVALTASRPDQFLPSVPIVAVW